MSATHGPVTEDRAGPGSGGDRIWITRAEPGAARTARRLTALGFTPVVAPVLAIQTIPGAIDDLPARLAEAAALVFTSRNAVAVFAALATQAGRDPPGFTLPVFALPIFAVGDATAEAARAAGFTSVISAAGDVARLAQVIGASGLPTDAVLLHPGAALPAGDLIGLLKGVATVQAWPIYASVETDVDAPEACAAVLIHSPRAGQVLAKRWANGAALPPTICAISAAAAEPLASATPHPIHIAARPDEAALLACLQAALGKPRPPV